jgi:hypothetical protein
MTLPVIIHSRTTLITRRAVSFHSPGGEQLHAGIFKKRQKYAVVRNTAAHGVRL